MQCNCCGKFRKEAHLVGMWGEHDETWIECIYCMSPNDLGIYFKNKPEIIELVRLKELECTK